MKRERAGAGGLWTELSPRVPTLQAAWSHINLYNFFYLKDSLSSSCNDTYSVLLGQAYQLSIIYKDGRTQQVNLERSVFWLPNLLETVTFNLVHFFLISWCSATHFCCVFRCLFRFCSVSQFTSRTTRSNSLMSTTFNDLHSLTSITFRELPSFINKSIATLVTPSKAKKHGKTFQIAKLVKICRFAQIVVDGQTELYTNFSASTMP